MFYLFFFNSKIWGRGYMVFKWIRHFVLKELVQLDLMYESLCWHVRDKAQRKWETREHVSHTWRSAPASTWRACPSPWPTSWRASHRRAVDRHPRASSSWPRLEHRDKEKVTRERAAEDSTCLLQLDIFNIFCNNLRLCIELRKLWTISKQIRIYYLCVE